MTSAPRKKIDKEVLDHDLMMLLEVVDAEKNPATKLEVLKLGYTLIGTLECKGMRRSPASETPGGNGQPSTGMYQTLFKRLALNPGPTVVTEEAPKPPPNARPLYPPTTQAAPPPVAPGTPLPIEGEAIDEAPREPGAPRRRRTIEL